MSTITTRRCAAWIGCGNLEVPVDQLSFRGFCPDCERVALSDSACCFEGCTRTATRQLGHDVYFPMCDQHAAQVQP